MKSDPESMICLEGNDTPSNVRERKELWSEELPGESREWGSRHLC